MIKPHGVDRLTLCDHYIDGFLSDPLDRVV
jgi:hypothetical protein